MFENKNRLKERFQWNVDSTSISGDANQWDERDRKWLYEKMRKNGVNTGSYETFSKDLENKEDRDWYYNKSLKLGLDVGSEDDFSSMMLPPYLNDKSNDRSLKTFSTKEDAPTEISEQKPQPKVQAQAYQQTAQNNNQSTIVEDSNRGATDSITVRPQVETSQYDAQVQQPQQEQTKQGEQAQRQVQEQSSWQPTPEDLEKVRKDVNLNGFFNRIDKSKEDFISQMNNMQKARSGAGKERKFNAEKGIWEDKYYTSSGEEVNTPLEQSLENLKKRDEWEAATVEGKLHKRNRIAKDSETRINTTLQKFDPENTAALVWQSAEEASGKDFKDYLVKKNTPTFKNLLRWFAQANNATGGQGTDLINNSISAESMHLKYHDLYEMADDAWNMLGEEKQNAIIDDIHYALKNRFPQATDEQLQKAAKEMAREQSDMRMFEYAVQQNAPKDALDFFLRKVAGANAFGTLMQMAARVQAGTTGDWEAKEVAEQRFGENHKIAGIAGMVTGFALDPAVLASAGVGSGVLKGGMSLASKYVGEAAVRKFGTTLGGRMLGGAIAGGANFATFEGLGEALNQIKWGGELGINEETGRYEVGDYSLGAVGGQVAHGLRMGAATGIIAPYIGNVSDKLVKATSSTVGKTGLRAAELGVSTVAEGTIFSVPEMFNALDNAEEFINQLSDENSPYYIADEKERQVEIDRIRENRNGTIMDVWTDNLAMIAGFKTQHALKSAPRVISELANSKAGKAGFETRLRRILDGQPELSLTDDEKRELENGGYSDLTELTSEYSKYLRQKAKYDKSLVNVGKDIPEPELPYNRFVELIKDNSISEAARAKMYYYVTGHLVPMSSVLGYNMIENKDSEGKVKGYVVQSIGANGVITSRTFDSKSRAEVEVGNIMRQAELNSVDIGERAYDYVAENKRLWDACMEYSLKPGVNVRAPELYRLVRMLDEETANRLFGEIFENVKNQGTRHSSAELREQINEHYGVDVDKAIGKERNRRSEAEQKAIDDYMEKLYSIVDVKRPTEQTKDAPSYFVDPNVPHTNEEFANLLGISEDADDNKGMEDKSPDFMRGYKATPEERRDICIELLDPDNTVAQEAWKGVLQSISDEADMLEMTSRADEEKRRHADGKFHPIVLKGKDRGTKYLIDGNIVFNEDGTVDAEKTDNTVVVYDPATDKKNIIAPTSDFGVLQGLEPYTITEADRLRERNKYVRYQVNDARGLLNFEPGDNIVLPTGENAQVLSIDLANDEIAAALENGTLQNVSIKELQRIHDEKILKDYNERHPKNTKDPQGSPEESISQPEEKASEAIKEQPIVSEQNNVKTGVPEKYEPNMEIAIRNEDGTESDAVIMGYVRYENGKFVPDENGNIIEYYSNNEVLHEHKSELDKKVLSYTRDEKPNEQSEPISETIAESETKIDNTPQQTVVDEQPQEQEPINTVVNNSIEQPITDETQAEKPQDSQQTQTVEQQSMPRFEDGEENWYATTPEQAHSYVYNEAGLSRSEANDFVNVQVEEARKNLLKAQNSAMPKMGKSIQKFNEQKKLRLEKIEQAKNELGYWEKVREIQNGVSRTEQQQFVAEQERLHNEAVAKAQADYEARKKFETEREKVGFANPMPAIEERYNATPKKYGYEDEISLPDGTVVKGRFVLHESGATTPSHNSETFAKSEGFPMDENGNSVNDRDYDRDLQAQQHTKDMAASYDQRALQEVPIVSKQGVVLSGNGRTMGREIAARNNTDAKYIEYLKNHPQKFGFTADDVTSMQHPSVSFELAEELPYTAETFAKFNQQEKKTQNKTEQAVKLGKTVKDELFGRIVNSIKSYDSLNDFYSDADASLNSIYQLKEAGILSKTQLAEMTDGAKGNEKLSALGREFLENMLIGKAFSNEPDVLRMLTEEPAMRQTVITALGEIADNIVLDNGYSLQNELSEAIKLCYEARNSGAKYGDIVSVFARQGILFVDPDELQTAADFNNASILMIADALNDKRVTLLKTVLQLYNDRARQSAAGQADIFTGTVEDKETILKDVLNYIYDNYGKRKELEKARQDAVERRKAEGIQQNGNAERGDAGSKDATNGNDGRGSNGSLAGRKSGDLAKTEVTAPISGEINEFGKPFILSSDGTTTFGSINEDSGLKAAPIKLSLGENYVDENGINHGYGLLHIEAGHGKQILDAGFSSVEEFVESVAKNYDNIKEGYQIGNKQTYLLEVSDVHNNTLFVQLSIDGGYWNVNSAGIFRKKYSHRKREVASLPTIGNSSNTETVEVNRGHSNGVTATSENSSLTSASKGSDNSVYEQGKSEKLAAIEQPNEMQVAVATAEAETNVKPTEAQKEAGNYKKGHLKIDGFDVSIEQPIGSVRRGTDADGKQWEQKMNNTYGYIRGTKGVDGDHIDIFLSDDPSQGDVFVVDQINKDGSFDEHKVMYGFADIESARKAYLSNYEESWQGLGAITPVSKEEFKKWINSSQRKTKPFADYKSVKASVESNITGQERNVSYTIEPTSYTNKKGKTTPMHLVSFGRELSKEEILAGKEIAKESRGWWDREQGGFMMRSEEAAKELAKKLAKGDEEIVRDAQPLSLEDVRKVSDVNDLQVKVNSVTSDLPKQEEPKYDNSREDEIFDKTQELIAGDIKTGKYKDIQSVYAIISKLEQESKAILDRVETSENKAGELEKLANVNGQLKAFEYMLPRFHESIRIAERNEALAKYGIKIGDKIMYQGKEATVYDADARYVTLDTGLAPIIYTNVPWEEAELPENNVSQPKKINVENLAASLKKDGKAKLSDFAENNTDNTKAEHANKESNKESNKNQEQPKEKSKWVNDEDADRFEELRERLRRKLGGQMNMGVDPEVFAIGVEMSYLMLKKGARKFGEFAKNLIEALGDEVRPYIKAFYNGARDLPEMTDYEKEMTPYEEVRSFDVMNFDKTGAKDLIATAENIALEQVAERALKDTNDKLKKERNEQRKQREQQIAADTKVIASKAETIASEAESLAKNASDGAKLKESESKIDESLNKVNEQLALLGYYEAEEVEKDYNEAYGYMRNAEKKALTDAAKLAKQLADDLGIDLKITSSTSYSKSKKQTIVNSNIAPLGGDISIRLPLNEGKELYINIGIDPEQSEHSIFHTTDNLQVKGIMYRIDSPKESGTNKYGSNMFTSPDVTYGDLLKQVSRLAKDYLPEKSETDKATKQVLEILKSGKAPKKTKEKPVKPEQQLGSLFDNLVEKTNFAETKDNNNGQNVHLQSRTGTSERESGYQRRQNEPLGASKQYEDERTDSRGMAGRSGSNSMSDTGRSTSVSELSDSKSNVSKSQQELSPISAGERKNVRNNHVERASEQAPKSTTSRIDANIAAIETMQRLMESGAPATPKDMEILRKFSGWGGLGAAFKEYTEYDKRLRNLLSPDAYEAANLSRNTAYYTPAPVIDAMWDIARTMGFRGGNVLEGSAGIGKILGLMPMDLSERSNLHAVEIDETTGGILSLLYPDANVEIKGFETVSVPNGSIDLAITNVPFGDIKVTDTTGDKDLSRKFRYIHDFCIAKNVRKLKEGGLGIFISSSGTLDSPTSAKLRLWLTNEGNSDVVGAFRLNNQTFGGAGVTADIIVVRKRVNGKKSANAIDISSTSPIRTVEYNTGETKRGSNEVIIKDLALDINKHFAEHPEDMAGEMAFAFERGDNYRATSAGLYPKDGINQEQRLTEWTSKFKDMDWDKAEELKPTQVVYEELGKDAKEGSMILDKNGNLCLAQQGKAVPLDVNSNKVKGHTKAECFNSYKAIKDALNDVLSYQTNNSDETGLQEQLKKLNKAYDAFVDTYGHLNNNRSIPFLRKDIDFPSIAALENFKETGDKSGKRIETFGKTDIFFRRVVEKENEPKPTTVKDGVITSIYLNGRIDVPYISEQLGLKEEEVRNEIISKGLGFENPVTTEMEVSYEYLSGNVREKLRQARENNTDGRYDTNIKALEKIIPMNIPAHLIEFTLGSSWVEPKLYEDFVKERTGIDVKLTNAGGTWVMNEPYWVEREQNKAMGVKSELCNKTIYGHELIKAAITCKSITVSKTETTGYGSNKSTQTIVDKEATMLCASKVDEIRQDFKDWARDRMQKDPAMSERMEATYNELFNNSVPLEIPDEFVPEHFGGAATIVNGKNFKLRPHQAKAVIRATTQPLMLAHEVGTGKTYTLITTAMEMRRLGTARKPMIVVQNATVGQFVSSAKALYPNAKILTLEDTDRKKEGRYNFYAKIRYNDWDMIVVPQSVFELIPDSEERQIRFVEDKVEEKMAVLEKMRDASSDSKDPAIRQAERELKSLQDELNDLKVSVNERNSGGEKDKKREAKIKQNAKAKAQEMLDRETDDVIDFDEMGIDALLIDEAHEYKHLGFATAMQRGVKGVDSSYSKKSQGAYLKTQAVLENNNYKNVVFATGTPISNTAAEIWTFMRYLMPADTMKEYGIYYFDDFVRNFGNIQQMLEFSTNGKFKENNRFAGYVNLPELVRIWSGIADTVLTREAGGVSDKIPEIEGGKAVDIYLPQTKALRSVMKFVKSQLDAYDKMSGKEKKANNYIPLKMFGIAKAAAVDARLVLEDDVDEPNSKTNEAVRQTLRSLNDTKDYNGTVAIFADNYMNKSTGFNLYEDIRKKLIEAGVPEDRIVVMKSGMSIKKKLETFDKVNSGEVRVIMGSTFTLGTGVNIQERLHTLIHIDAPNRPMDYTQRNGRILRQGNLHNDWGLPVRVIRFGVEDSLDVTAYQRLKTKGAIADSIMEGKKLVSNSMENRVLEEEQDLFSDMTAQLSGSQYALLKNQIEKEVRKLESQKKGYEVDQTYIHNQKPRLKGLIQNAEKRISDSKEALAKVESAKIDGIKVGGKTFESIESMADYIKDYNSKQKEQQEKVRTAYGNDAKATSDLAVEIGGFTFNIHRVINKEQKQEKGQLSISFYSKTQMTYSCPELGLEDVPVDYQRLKSALEDIVNNVLTGKDFRERLEYAERDAERYKSELEQIVAREGKPFEHAEALKTAKQKLAEYEKLMKAELAEKEAKYAEMDSEVEEAKGVTYTEEDSEEVEDDDDNNVAYRLRKDAPPTKTGIGYKVFVLKKGKLYPPMVANPNGEATPFGVWLDADAAPIAGVTKTGRQQVKAGGKGTQGGSGKLSYRPGWHLGEIPYALQFNRLNSETGQRELFPANFVWAEVEYANDVDYQKKAMSYGINKNGKFQHSLAGLPYLPENGSYKYRTNPDPNTDDWVITGAMKVNRILRPSEVDAMVEESGREPQERQAGAITDKQVDKLNAEIRDTMRKDSGMKRQLAEVLGEKLNTRINIIEDVNSITHANKEIENRRRNAKGWYDKKTGEIYVVLDNNTDVEDVSATVFHETVAHKGLRELVGEENYDKFLDEVYSHLQDELKSKIDREAGNSFFDDATKNGEKAKAYEQHRRNAVDELFGEMAEKPFEEFTKGERTIWQKIKDAVLKAINKFLGSLKLPKWVTLGDNELRYMLWRSKERLEHGKEHPIDMARDLVMRKELGLEDSAVYTMGDSPESFKERQRKAVENKGTVMPGLNDAQVKVVDVPRHSYSGNIQEATQQALDAAKKKYVPNGEPKTLYYNNFGKMFKYSISGNAVEIVLSPKHQGKSINKGVHLALAEHLDRVVAESIEVEEHPDRLKKDGVRVNDEFNPNTLMHRFYGVARIDGKDYSVMTLMKEEVNTNRSNGIHSYDVQKIKVLDDESPNTLNGVGTPNSELEGYPVAKVIKNIDKTMVPGEKLLDASKLADEDTSLYRESNETGDVWKDGSIGLDERITMAATRLAMNHKDNVNYRNEAIRAINANLTSLNKAMSLQKKFDKATVKRVYDLARVLIQNGYISNMSQGEMMRLLAAVKNSVGKENIEDDVQKILDIMVNNQLKNAENVLHSIETIKGSKVDAKGVEVQGQLDPDGVQVMRTFSKARGWQKADIVQRMSEAQARIGSEDEAVSRDAALEYTGLQYAMEYIDNIQSGEIEESNLREELKQVYSSRSKEERATDEYKELKSSLEEAIRQSRIERVQEYHDLINKLSGTVGESIEKASQFKEEQKQRIRDIQHYANSDMEGRPCKEHYKLSLLGKFVNSDLFSFITAPLATFEQMMKMLGRKSANGEGYLYNYFVRGIIDARQKEIKGVRGKYKILDNKAKEIFGVDSWGDLIKKDNGMPKVDVVFKNGGKPETFKVSQGNLMYIYMVDKMLDGRMKLRKMGITEEKVEEIKNILDPRFIQLADWIQDEFLVKTRNEYNETHKRLFGASMAAIEHYFPLKILANARVDKAEDLDNEEYNDGISTTTGSIIKRRRNVLALDLLNSNALSVILDHVATTEHWNAYAEMYRDINTLRTYKRFRNQVENMTTIYGSGEKLWRTFNDVCQLACGRYRPKRGNFDAVAVNIAKGASTAKVSFRLYTALKQLLSFPAYLPEVNAKYIAQDVVNPVGAWKWCSNNLPIFKERWDSRMSGDPRLLRTGEDWSLWKQEWVRIANRIGMSPNAFIDALTVSIGAHSIYKTRFDEYVRDGYSEELAERKAIQDAETAYNQTQQSSEGIYVSPIQIDKTWASTVFSLFGNARMAYTRKFVESINNLSRNLNFSKREERIEFMKKQYVRDGIDEEKAEANAKRKLNRQIIKDLVNFALFGFGMQVAWYLGSNAYYLLFGDDDEEKQKMINEALTRSMFGGIEGLAGGDVMSQAGSMMLLGEGNPTYLTKDMPFASDVSNIYSKLNSSHYAEAVTDIVNLAVQTGIGANPQSISEAVMGIVDACGGDVSLAHEAAICIGRILNVPKSQIDKLYFDEVDLSGDEVSDYSPKELAERYARHKLKRDVWVAPWEWNDSIQINKYENVAKSKIKERVNKIGNDTVNLSYEKHAEEYKAMQEKVKSIEKETDFVKLAEKWNDIYSNQDEYEKYNKYLMFKDMDKQLDDIVNKYLNSESSEEAKLCHKMILDYKASMIEVLDAEDTDVRKNALTQNNRLMQEFLNKYWSLHNSQPNR